MFQATRSTTSPGRTALVVLAVLSLLLAAFAVAAPVIAVDTYATVTDHEPHSNEANAASYWGTNCTKPAELEYGDDSDTKTYVLPALAAGWVYDQVIVKAGSGSSANTIFDNPLGGTTVFADTNGNNVFDAEKVSKDIPADKEISHIIICTSQTVSPGVTVTPPTCEANGSFQTTAITGVTYNIPGGATFGVPFTITTTLAQGYVLATGNTGSFTITVLAQLTGEQCEEEEELIEVSPEVTVVPPTCDEDGSFTLSEIGGVTYSYDADWEFGEEFTITTTLAEGYVLAAGNTGSFTITVLAQLTGEQCEEEPDTGTVKIFKTMCTVIGQQNTCNEAKDTSLDGYHIDFEIYAGTGTSGTLVETVTVTLGENEQGQGNLGDGSFGKFDSGDLPVGTYTVCEIPVAYLDNVEVDLVVTPRPEAGDGGSTGGQQTLFDDNCIVVVVTKGTATVKFLDQKDEEEEPDTATIVVDKVVSGTGASGTEPFEISVTGEEDFDLSANDTAATFLVEIGDGTYAVDETLTEAQEDAGWTLTSIVCTSDEHGEVDETEFTLEADETVTCVITNAFQAPVTTGSITIVKDTVPNGAQDFSFTSTGPTATGPGLGVFVLDDDADGTEPNSRTFTGLAPGQYTVIEVRNGDYTVSINCSTGGSADATNDRRANITLVAGATVTCTFVNTLITVAPTPTLVVDKVASTETITITGPAGALVASPSVVTWTLSYTLTNGPVSGAVITDPLPTGFTFLDASNGGTLVGNTVTWNLGTLSASGSVTFRTTVDPVTVARGVVTNTATIDSTETAPDNGQDSVTVSQTGTQGSVSTPVVRTGTATSTGVPNTATSADAGLTAAAMLGVLMLLSAGVFVSAAIGSGRRRR